MKIGTKAAHVYNEGRPIIQMIVLNKFYSSRDIRTYNRNIDLTLNFESYGY